MPGDLGLLTAAAPRVMLALEGAGPPAGGRQNGRPAMKARVGDRLVKDVGDTHRVCEIIGLHHADGSPPYVVRWLSDGHIALLYPGPYTRLVHGRPGRAEGRGTAERAAGAAVRAEPAGSPGAGRDRAARAPGAGRRWPRNPFLPAVLTAPSPGGAA